MGFVLLQVNMWTLANSNVHFWLMTRSFHCSIAADNDEVVTQPLYPHWNVKPFVTSPKYAVSENVTENKLRIGQLTDTEEKSYYKFTAG